MSWADAIAEFIAYGADGIGSALADSIDRKKFVKNHPSQMGGMKRSFIY